MVLRRFLPFIILALSSTFFVFVVFENGYWRRLPQLIGFGEAIAQKEDGMREVDVSSDLRISKPDPHGQQSKESAGWSTGNIDGFTEPVMENTSPYPIGKTKPAGSEYTKRLVIAKTMKENTSWIDEQLGDIIDDGHLDLAIYVVDDRKATFRVPKNKGHEVMVYLTYIIDHYDSLPDVSMFMHAHQFAWHNNEMLSQDAGLMVRHLSPERVTREGYMSLRCHWDPGCPDWLHPGAVVEDDEKQEEVLIAEYWTQLFPFDPIPTVLAQPCCAQFAVSRERIQALPRRRYVMMRDWLLHTELSDYFSGRVFEYAWQFIFSATPIHCPSMSVCYCDGYGICFGGPEEFDYWFELRYQHDELTEKLRIWRQKADVIEDYRRGSKWGEVPEEALLRVPEVGRDKWLNAEIDRIADEMLARMEMAMERGKDPRNRALEAGRPWKEGDGF